MNARHVVLVVEDEPLVRMELVDTLENVGYRCLEAASAMAAIAVLELHPEIRVVFTDVQMPGGMDGIGLAQYVRTRWPPTLIVVASGMVDLATCRLPDGATRIAKPYDHRTLGRVLEHIQQSLV